MICNYDMVKNDLLKLFNGEYIEIELLRDIIFSQMKTNP